MTQTSLGRRWESQQNAAARLGVDVKTIRRYISEGRLVGYRLADKAIRLDSDEVDALFTPIPAAGA